MSKETKIGLLTIVTIALGIWGYMFLKGRNAFSREQIVYVEYQDVDELSESSPVFLNGFQVGIVSAITMKPDDAHKVLVAITLRRDIRIPKNTIAELSPASIMGGKSIKLRFDKPCNGDCAVSGDFIQGIRKGVISAMMTPEELEVYLQKARNGINPMMDSLNMSFRSDDSEVGKTLRDIQATVGNLKKTTAALTTMMQASSKNINASMANMESITSNLQKSNAEITQMLSNSKDFTSKLSKLELDKTVGGANDAMLSVKKTLEKSEAAIADLNSILAEVKKGNGSLGSLIYDDKFIKNLNETILSVDMLSRDLNLHPKRYRSMIWGRERTRTPFPQDAAYQQYLQDRDSIKTYQSRLKK
jgi:phospholipid/cholesterol/gamma-HCH transport system substrate-binding protein